MKLKNKAGGVGVLVNFCRMESEFRVGISKMSGVGVGVNFTEWSLSWNRYIENVWSQLKLLKSS